MHRSNWDDLRFVLAVADCGSVSAASRALGVNHATVLRRISAFEEAQGTAIFDRAAQGYTILPDKLRVIEAARGASVAMERVEQLLRGAGDGVFDRIRITSTDTICQAILPRALAALPPDLGQVEIRCSNEHIDMSRLQADITVRPTSKLPADLTGEMVGELRFAVYCAPGSEDAEWLGLMGALGRTGVANWMADTFAPSQIVGGADSFLILQQLVGLGGSKAILPQCLGEPDPRLKRLDVALPFQAVPVWVACHNDLASVPRLRKFSQALAKSLSNLQELISGTDAR